MSDRLGLGARRAWPAGRPGRPAGAAATTKIVLIAGRPSHGPGDHEFNAGTKLLVKCLKEIPGIEPVFVAGGWPEDESVFEGAKAVVFFMDGGGGHPMIQGDRLEDVLRRLMDQGVGLACLHYAVEVPKGEAGRRLPGLARRLLRDGLLDQPALDGRDQEPPRAPDHPRRQAVRDQRRVVLQHPLPPRDEGHHADPRGQARRRDPQGRPSSPRGPYPHIVAAKGRDEVLAWAVERPDGGRGFGFTGGHFHKNWGNPDFRTLVLNAILWTAKLDVPSGGRSVHRLRRGAEAEPRPQARPESQERRQEGGVTLPCSDAPG